MIQFRTIQPVEIEKGHVIELSREQATPRLHNLKFLKGSKYEVKATVTFKAGEIIGIDPGKVSKGFLMRFEPAKDKQD